MAVGRYEVQTTLYGTRNLVHRLYLGGIFLAGTDEKGPNNESSSSMETTIERANTRNDVLKIRVETQGEQCLYR